MKKLLQMKFMLLLCALIVGSGTMWAADPTNVTINFGTTTGYWAAHTNATYTDSDSRVWTRTCSVSNMSGQGGYSQFGNASNTCGSLVFTATAGTDMTVTAFSVTMAGASGGNSPTTGTIYLYKVSGTTETQLATLSVNGSNSVTCSIESSQSFSSTDILKVSYAGTAKAIRISKLEYSYTTSGGDQPTTWTVTYDANGATSGDVPVDENEYDTENSTVTVLGNTGSLAKTGCAFSGWNTQANGGGTNYDADDTFTISANTTLYAKWTPYTITAQSNNESYGTVTLSGNEITGSPNSGYRYANPAYTVAPENSATVAQDGNTFTVTPTANTTITINFEAIPTHTATFSVNGTTTTTDFQEGAAITFPANPADIEGKSFVGWTETAISGTTDETPTFVTSATMGNADMTFYAVFANAEGDSETKLDVLTSSVTGNTTSSYANFSNKSVSGGSNAVYAGNCAGSNSYIQLRTSSNTGIVSTTSGGKAKKVTVSWSSTIDRALQVYGSNTAYTGLSDIFDDNKKGTLLGTLTYGSTTELSITGDYAYIGIKPDSSKSGASQLSNITIDWETSSITYSGYCTTVAADTREEAGLGFAESTATVEWYVADQYTGQNLTNPNNVSPITWTSSNEGVATVENGTVTVLALGETTIKASFDGDENYKKGEASYTLTVKDSRLEPTVTIHDTFITHTNVFEGTAAGKLTASVKYNDNTIEGATVTWSGDNDAVATINATHGYVDLVAVGTVTFTATYAGNANYKPAEASYVMTVTYSDPNAPGTVNNPYTVDEARAAIDAGTGVTDVYATGIVSEIVTAFNSQFGNITYNISADGLTTSDQLQAYRGKSYNGDAFTSADDIQVGDVVVVKGNLINYQGTYEFAQGNQLVSLVRKPAAPTFDPEAGSYTSVQNVTISTTTAGATIYYTTDGTAPTTESTQYSGAITVDESMTIKAIAVKDSQISDVATAVYDIDLSPVITVASPIELDGNTPSKNITISYNNFTPESDDFGVVYCDENGDELSGGYDWIEKIAQWIDETPNTATMTFMFDPNTGSAPRTAYMKIYAMNGNDRVYSELITITQEVYVEPTKVSFYVNGVPIQYSYLEEGDPIVFPEVSDIDGMTFLGWTSNEINGTTDTAPEFVDVTSAKMGTESIDYYAVFAVNSGIGSYTLDYSKEENLSSSTDWGTYGKVLNYEAEDGSVWTIKAYKNAGMQINNGKDCSIKVPGCPGYISTIEITCSAAKAVGFSSNNYEGSGNITYVAEGTDATSQTLNLSNSIINTGYIVPKGGSTSITKIIVNYSIYSDYCTTIPTTGMLTLNAACHDNKGKIYGTFYTNRPYIMPATLRGSVVSVDDGKLVVDEVYDGSNSEVVPANTALLISTADNFTGTHDYTITYATGGDDYSESNMLKGTLTADEETEGDGCLFYRLTMHNGETIGFWWGAAEGGKFKPGANKAYLAVPTSVVSARSGFAFDDEATGISQIENGKLKMENYYDLQGRKVNKPGKGLYIVNGKKVVIK